MKRCVIWIEGVDFDDTLFDSQKLSVIRGASRALEEMAFVAHAHFEKAFPGKLRRITAGASQAGFTVAADETTAQAALDTLMALLRTQGYEPSKVEPVARYDKAIRGPVGDTAIGTSPERFVFVPGFQHDSLRPAQMQGTLPSR